MYCNKCGNELDDESKFCSKCGNKIGKDNIVNEEKVKIKKDSKIKQILLIILVILIHLILFGGGTLTFLNTELVTANVIYPVKQSSITGLTTKNEYECNLVYEYKGIEYHDTITFNDDNLPKELENSSTDPNFFDVKLKGYVYKENVDRFVFDMEYYNISKYSFYIQVILIIPSVWLIVKSIIGLIKSRTNSKNGINKVVLIPIIFLIAIIVGSVIFFISKKESYDLNNSSQNSSLSTSKEKNDNSDDIDREELLDNNYNTAVAEIKKCLKDVNWLKQNIYVTEDEMISNDVDISDQEINFIVCKSDTKPIIVVETSSFNNLSRKIDLVTYENNKVKVERIGEMHITHGGYDIDANKCVVRTEYMYMGECKTSLHSIVDGKINLLGLYGYYENYIGNTDDNIELKDTYYIGFDTNFNNNKEVSEDEYERYNKNLNEEQYNFVSIDTRLTSENIDLYINGY